MDMSEVKRLEEKERTAVKLRKQVAAILDLAELIKSKPLEKVFTQVFGSWGSRVPYATASLIKLDDLPPFDPYQEEVVNLTTHTYTEERWYACALTKAHILKFGRPIPHGVDDVSQLFPDLPQEVAMWVIRRNDEKKTYEQIAAELYEIAQAKLCGWIYIPAD